MLASRSMEPGRCEPSSATACSARLHNVLASSIVLVCRPRQSKRADGGNAAREFQEASAPSSHRPWPTCNAATSPRLTSRRPPSARAWRSFTRYRKCSTRTAADVRSGCPRAHQRHPRRGARGAGGDFDADSRWALTWFEQYGFTGGEYGVAEQLSKAKNTSVDGLVRAGVVESRHGNVRLLKPDELDPDWDPAADSPAYRVGDDAPSDPFAQHQRADRRPTGGRSSAARPRPPAISPTASTRSANAGSAPRTRSQYNGLVQSWPEIVRIAGEQRAMTATQGALAIDGA